jgi:hypothetical protein
MRRHRAPTRGLAAFGLTAAAFLWGVALVVGAFTVPVYEGTMSSATEVDGHTRVSTAHTTATLVDENGLRVVVLIAIPALIAAVVWWALRRKCAGLSTRAGRAAWTLTGLLLAFSVLTGFTIGAAILPAALALVGACALTPSAPRSTA